MPKTSPDTFESFSYRDICSEIRKVGHDRLGKDGYSRIVFTNGVFDLFHLGHLQLLNECRSLAGPRGAVVVGVNSDASVKRLKGPSRPIIDEVTRATMLIYMKPVDHVVSFDEDTPIRLIEALRPDVIVKGSDYKGKEIVGSELSAIHLVNLKEGFSTSSIIERIKNG